MKEHYAAPTDFINKHRQLPVPHRETALVLVDQDSYKMRLYTKGSQRGEYEVSFGQGKGQKLVQGDNKTPKGMYFVFQKHRGEFGGTYAKYYGGHWIKINYPNKFDAARAKRQESSILSKPPLLVSAGKNAPLPSKTPHWAAVLAFMDGYPNGRTMARVISPGDVW